MIKTQDRIKGTNNFRKRIEGKNIRLKTKD